MPMRFLAVAVALAMALTCFAFAPLSISQAEASQTCPEFTRTVFLTKKPFQVNPGGKCHVRFTFEIPLPSQTSKPQRLCIFARAPGSDAEYGPFCSDGENVDMGMPAQPEWLWSDRSVRMIYKLCDTLAECR